MGKHARNDFQAMVLEAGLVVSMPAEYKYIVYGGPTTSQERILAELREIFGFDE